MSPEIGWNILADLPNGAGYISPIKVGVVAALVFLWGLAAQWVDRDTNTVKTKREQWNLIVIAGAFVSFLVLFVVPWTGPLFLVGVGFWILIAGGALMLYVLHRNSRVVPAARVLTIGHIKRLTGRDTNRRVKDDKGLRVRLENFEGKFVNRPDDVDELADFDAVQDFLYDALWRRVSEIDMRSGKQRYRVVQHIDGVPIESKDGISVESGERILRFLKRVAGLNTEEIRRPQSGQICAVLLSHTGATQPSQITTSGTTAGERMRIKLQIGPTLLRLPELGFAPPRIDALKSVLGKSNGLLIISAAPQHGATTTQYAILRSHDAYIHNIHALERRLLLELDNITQQVYDGANTDVDYARMLQTLLRREPDIILVGDCDDHETALIATRVAAEDRKIYLGMVARDAFDALQRYLKFVDDNDLASKALLGVINQRLVRKLCSQCREAYRPDAATLKKLNLPADKIEAFHRPPSEPKLDKRGREIICKQCQGTGYVGRTGVFELLIADDTIRDMILKDAPTKAIKAQCRKNKMYYLQEEGLLKVIDGTTSMNEVLRVLRNSQ